MLRRSGARACGRTTDADAPGFFASGLLMMRCIATAPPTSIFKSVRERTRVRAARLRRRISPHATGTMAQPRRGAPTVRSDIARPGRLPSGEPHPRRRAAWRRGARHTFESLLVRQEPTLVDDAKLLKSRRRRANCAGRVQGDAQIATSATRSSGRGQSGSARPAGAGSCACAAALSCAMVPVASMMSLSPSTGISGPTSLMVQVPAIVRAAQPDQGRARPSQGLHPDKTRAPNYI